MIAGGNHTLIPNLPPVSCDYDPALAGGRLSPLPQRVRFIVGDGALDVPFRMPSMPVRKRRGGYQPPVSCGYDPALAGGRLPPLPSQIL